MNAEIHSQEGTLSDLYSMQIPSPRSAGLSSFTPALITCLFLSLIFLSQI